MQYKKQVWAWLTAMVLCAVVAVVLGSCGGGDGSGNGGGDDAGAQTPTTIANVADKLIGCGFSGRDALVHRLELDFSLANKQANGVVVSQAAQSYFEKVASAFMACLVAAPCAELSTMYCPEAPSQADDTLKPCFAAVETKYAGQLPGAAFKCSDGTVLESPASAVCNGIADCADKSDETSQACTQVAHIECDAKSAPEVWRCNNAKQCTDGADELNCFACSASEVTGNANRCNGREDCGSGADEQGCSDGFVCPGTFTDAGAGDGGEAADAGTSIDAGADAGRLPDGGVRQSVETPRALLLRMIGPR